MRERAAWAVMLALVLGMAAVAGEGGDEGFVPIFNGKDLTGWDGDPTFWSAKDDAIRGESTKEKPCKRNTFCIWKAGVLEDFELKLTFRIHSGNSGIQYRSLGLGNWVVSGYQAEVCNQKGKVGFLYHEKGRGYLANVGEKVAIAQDGKKEVVEKLGDKMELTKDYKDGDWNHYRIVAKGNHIQQFLNGVQTIDLVDNQLDDPKAEKPNQKAGRLKGILALQIHAGAPMWVEFKDILLKVLAPEAK
ncbi:MAG TPA: DUF1080 domain-containing protein [Planctomycetota bacterium]|nr:DUF1080 domain-containing protein [Planctomycetota bacterium]